MKVARTVLRGATLGNKCRLLDKNKLTRCLWRLLSVAL
uniref:Uncharacterized protein n=1 Tax=Vibrio genomosp. F6 TaxID=723172 RepID=A0A0H3ZLA5_9VIBR|nr:hypothetical protein [Vibrio genomosp. F6]